MNNPNYRDFYQRALIPIGLKDKAVLTESITNHSDPYLFSTHWLIAIEAVLCTKAKEYYHWKVSIYPSDSEGSYLWNHAFYCSSPMESLDRVIELAQAYEAYSRNDELHSALHEKIG